MTAHDVDMAVSVLMAVAAFVLLGWIIGSTR